MKLFSYFSNNQRIVFLIFSYETKINSIPKSCKFRIVFQRFTKFSLSLTFFIKDYICINDPVI